MRLRDIGDVHLCSASGLALPARAAVLLHEDQSGARWGGQLWPYRALAVTPGRYTLLSRGEALGAITVRMVRAHNGREVADFTGDLPPCDALRRQASHGGGARFGHAPRYPRVSGDVEPTFLVRVIATLAVLISVFVTLPRRIGRRGWGRPTLRA